MFMPIDYQELNKITQKDKYPLLLPDEVQDKLTGATVFTTLDLQFRCKLPKTAFCVGSGMGLFEFCCMSFGLTGVPCSFERLIN